MMLANDVDIIETGVIKVITRFAMFRQNQESCGTSKIYNWKCSVVYKSNSK